jgi:hypothetical protein
MSQKTIALLGQGSLELIEEAVHLLRRAPLSALTAYYVGSLPFVIAFLFFWGDMSRSAFAADHCVSAAFGLSLFFFWMKSWQAIFLSHIQTRLTGEMPSPWTRSRIVQLVVTQMALQPLGLFVLPIALVTTLPFGWAYAFFQNVTALWDREERKIGTVFADALKQARLWPGQNHVIISTLFLFGIFIFLNIATSLVFLPELVRMLTGVETRFSHGLAQVLNTTFLASTVWLTYLCIDPIVKTIYALRCFYGESLQSGEDLKVELKRFSSVGRLVQAAVVSLFFLELALSASAGQTGSPSPVSSARDSSLSIAAEDLDRSIATVLGQPEYSWRSPREKTNSGKEGRLFEIFVREVIEAIKSWGKAIARGIQRLIDLFQRQRGFGQAGDVLWFSWLTSAQGLLFVVLVALSLVLLFLLYRFWRRPQPILVDAVTGVIPSVPDLQNEGIGADQMPEESWVKLARELLERGELRLALRAFYLASLAHLAQRGLIRIAKYKSNHDYERELRRRTHALPDLPTTFERNVSVFNRVWYGRQEVSLEMLEEFSSNVERIKAC